MKKNEAIEPVGARASSLKLDKLRLDCDLSVPEMVAMNERLKSLKKKNVVTGGGKSKGEWHHHIYNLKLPSGAVITFLVRPMLPGGCPAQLVMNPDKIEVGDVEVFIALWKQLHPLNGRFLAASLRCRRVDVAADLEEEPLDQLVIDMESATAGAKVMVNTDGGGKLQSVYLGSVSSNNHGVAYDQDASDDYKRAVGEKLTRTGLKDNAELVVERKGRRLRLEHRQLFSPSIPLIALTDVPTSFGKYQIYKVSGVSKSKASTDFLMYVDSVRLRGVAGARKFLSEHAGKKRACLEEILGHEKTLSTLAVAWWKPVDYNTKLLDILRTTPIWKFLQPPKPRGSRYRINV